LTSSNLSRKTALFAWLRRLFRLQQVFAFVSVFVYTIEAVTNQRPSFGAILLCIFVVGNLTVPFFWLGSRIYRQRSFPWNWVFFLLTEMILAVTCAFGSVLLLRWTKIDPEPFWDVFRHLGPLIIVVVMTSGSVVFALDRLREKNQALEQTVEKGTFALQQQEEELKRASEIQQLLLPNTLPQLPGVQVAGAWQPAKSVGGDYFDVLKLDSNRLGICIGDVAGKGITAALLMSNLQASFRAFATPAAVCTKLNSFLCSNVASGKFVTFFYTVLDAEKHTLSYENAGHCPGFLIRSMGAVESLAGDGAVLGVFPDWIYQDFTVELNPGDRLLLFTDGITEAENAQLEEFGETRLVEAARGPGESALDIQRKIMQQVSAFCAGNYRDDATLIVVAIQ
jgi:phosphoserine phosphatase RsbU/P